MLPAVRKHQPATTQRANPFPKVTDPFCRLPLPTLFHQLEAVHLGDLVRLWVRTRTQPPSRPHFHGPSRALHTPRRGMLSRVARPVSGQSTSRARNNVGKKRKLFAGRGRASAGSCVLPRGCAWRPWNVGQVPFRTLHTKCILVTNKALRIGSPMANCCSHGTLPHFSLHGSHMNICYSHQDLHQKLLHAPPPTHFHEISAPSYSPRTHAAVVWYG